MLRKLLSMPVEDKVWGPEMGAAAGTHVHVNPRDIAQRILQIRAAIATELQQDMADVGEENSAFLRQATRASLEACMGLETEGGSNSREDQEPSGDGQMP
mmetsp:Transcript_20532/g.61181  ORF Transcript_20532/g.61181 Transcript_20532/m.61181 type:complete len:100 (+) Transcript_20532:387-686(+)